MSAFEQVERRGLCSSCQTLWFIADMVAAGYKCPTCGQTFREGSAICTIDESGRYLTPCTKARGDEEAAKGNAEWLADDLLQVFDTPAQRRRVREHVYHRDEDKCRWCGGPAATLDHIVPDSQRGPFVEWNLIAACYACNQARGSIPALLFLHTLIHEGRTPPRPIETATLIIEALMKNVERQE